MASKSSIRVLAACRPLVAGRPYHTTPHARYPFKDSQQNDSLRPSSDEHTRSARDDDVAALEEAPWCQDKTTPEDALLAAGKESRTETNVLEVSGANKEVSQHTLNVSIKTEEHKRSSRYGSTPGKGEKLRKSNFSKKTKTYF